VTLERTPIDKLIEPAVQKVAKTTKGYFLKSEVVNEIRAQRGLGSALAKIRATYTEWKFDQVILRYVDRRVGEVLAMKDTNGIRVYECYGAGNRERRWLPLRAMTADMLRAVMQETRVQARQLEIKGAGYEFFIDALAKLPSTATVGEVYEKVAPLIREYRAKAA